jgi:hypothetical protein
LNQLEANEIAYRAAGAAFLIRSSQPQPSLWPALIEKEPAELRALIRTYLKQHLRGVRQNEKQSSAGDAALAAIKKTINGE